MTPSRPALSSRRAAARILPLGLGLAALLLPATLLAQPDSPRIDPENREPATRSAERRAYVGMWTFHFRDVQRGVDNNYLIGLAWNGFYGATFVNSFDVRSFTAGVQGEPLRRDAGPVRLGVGYRLGLVTGYDERFTSWAGKTPVIPLIQPRLTVEGKRIGGEISYSGVIASFGASVRF